MASWMAKCGDEVIGPLTSQDLQSRCSTGEILPSDLVKKKGQLEWMTASSVRGLFPPGSAPHHVQKPDVTDAETDSRPRPPAFQQKHQVSRSNARRTKLLFSWGIVGLLAVALVATALWASGKSDAINDTEQNAESPDLIQIDRDDAKSAESREGNERRASEVEEHDGEPVVESADDEETPETSPVAVKENDTDTVERSDGGVLQQQE